MKRPTTQPSGNNSEHNTRHWAHAANSSSSKNSTPSHVTYVCLLLGPRHVHGLLELSVRRLGNVFQSTQSQYTQRIRSRLVGAGATPAYWVHGTGEGRSLPVRPLASIRSARRSIDHAVYQHDGVAWFIITTT